VVNSKIQKPDSKTSSLKEKQREERTTLILQAAYDVLVEKGYYEASMDEIAARVGISKGTLYLHFKSKEDLIFMLIEQETGKFLSQMDQIINDEISIHDRLEHILLETYKSIQSGRQFLLALRSIGLNAGLIRDRLESQGSVTGLTERLARLFEEGKSSGEFDVTVPTVIMVSIFLGLMEIYSNEQAGQISQLSPEDFSKSVTHLFFHGLLAKS
jgi:TetR/AcrR family transcriptional regulator, fatty acid metabolism regulator protein